MSFNARLNALDQELDIQGSLRQEQNRVLSDEPSQLGRPTGQTDAASSLVAGAPGGQMRVSSSLGIFSNADLTNFLTISGALTGSNNGTFAIVNFVDANTVDVLNASAAVPDGNNGVISLAERQPYSLEDDLNFERTDRRDIKGTTNFYDAVPTYQQTTNMGTNIPANLSNIATHTTDAMSLNKNLLVYASGVFSGTTNFLLSSPGNLKHSDNVDKSGVPIFDSANNTFQNDWTSCYVDIQTPDGHDMYVMSGSHAGEKIFGITVTGSSVSPNSVDVKWYSVPEGGNIATQSTPYTWEAGLVVTTASFYLGYNQRLDQLDINALRTQFTLGIESDVGLANDINNLYQVIGATEPAVSLAGLLTNTGPNYIFDVLSATPTVVQALNALNSGSGDRTYTGPYLTSGQTIAQSLQALSNGIASGSEVSGSVTRYITRLTGSVPAGVPIPTPAAYTLDGTNNGGHLMVFTRGLLRDPGTAATNDDYTETSTGTVTFFSQVKKGDHINWLTIK
jgi:hypothetical protein